MKNLLTVLAVIFSISLPVTVWAAHPLATEDSGTSGKLKFQVETSGEFGWDSETTGGVTTRTNSQTLNVCLTAGLLDPLDLIVNLPFSWQQIKIDGVKTYDNGGLNDVSLALKWRFLEIGPASFAVKPVIVLPSGDYNSGLGTARPAYGATLISTVELRPVAIHANIGYTHPKHTDVDKNVYRENIWNMSLAGTAEVLKGLQVVAEIAVATNGDKTTTTWPTFLTGGMIYSVIDNLDVSMGIKGGLTSPATDIALLTGLTWKFP